MKNKILIFIIVVLVVILTLTGCKSKSPDNTVETQPTESYEVYNVLTVAPETNKVEEKTEYGNTIFYFQPNSSVEKIKNGNPTAGDIVIINDYKYIYNGRFVVRGILHETNDNGWCVISLDDKRTSTSDINSTIFNKPVVSINYCYYGHSNLTKATNLPETIRSSIGAFESCHNLKTIDNLPETIIDARDMFAYCEDLEQFPELPQGLLYADRMFAYCIDVSGEINIPNSLKTYNQIFLKTTKNIKLKDDNINAQTIASVYLNVS